MTKHFQLLDDRQFRLLVNGIVDYGIYFLDVNGIVRSWNLGAQRLKGYSEKDIVGKHFSQFYTDEDRKAQEPQRVLLEAAEKGRFEGEGWRVKKDGERFWAHVVLDRLQDSQGNVIGFAKITKDITEEKFARDKLIESERRFRLLVSNVVDYAIYLLDINGEVSSWNAGAKALKGYEEEEVLGKHFSMFYLPEEIEAKKPWRALHTATRDGRFEGYGWRQGKGGKRFWAHVVIDPIYDENGELMGFAKITQDMTAQREQDAALRESEQRFRMLVEQVQGQSMYMLDLEGNITSWNAGAQALKGYRADEIIGQNFSQFYPEDARGIGKHLKALRTAATTGRYADTGERLKKDGSTFLAEVVMEALRDDQGRVMGFAKITRDVSDREERKLEQQYQKKIQQQMVELEQSNQELEQMASIVAHDIKAPLRNVASLVQLVQLDHGDDMPADALSDLQQASESCVKLQEMVEALLEYARFQRKTPVPTTVSVSHIMKSVQQTLTKEIEAESATVELDGDASLWGDRHMLELVLQNLVANAIKYRHPERAPSVCVVVRTLPQAIQIDIKDNGRGIPEKHQKRVFDMFYRAENKDNLGHGMGLSSCKKIVEKLHGGRMDLTSTTEVGSCFSVQLPRGEKEQNAA